MAKYDWKFVNVMMRIPNKDRVHKMYIITLTILFSQFVSFNTDLCVNNGKSGSQYLDVCFLKICPIICTNVNNIP